METKVRVIDLKSLEKAMTLYAKAKRNQVKLTTQMEERVQAICSKYADRINLCDEECKQLSQEMLDFARENRDEIFPKGTKHLELISGTIGYKQGRPSLVLGDGQTWNTVLEVLKKYDPDHRYIRTKYEVDRVGLLTDRNLPETARLIKRIGLTINDKEQFYVVSN